MPSHDSSFFRRPALYIMGLVTVLSCIFIFLHYQTTRTESDNTKRALTLGAVRIKNAHYVAVIEGFDFIGRLFGEPIFQVSQVSLEPIDTPDKKVDAKTLAIVEDYLAKAGFYYSVNHNLSLSAQCATLGACSKKRRQYFVANRYMLRMLSGLGQDIKQKYKRVKAIRGNVSFGCLNIQGRLLCGANISRTCTFRTSTRYASRGADKDGNVSNFVEKEMIISLGRDHGSFVQVSGSMPFKWHQKPSLDKLNPVFKIEPDDTINENRFKKHIGVLKDLYPDCDIALLNLVDLEPKKQESIPGKKFSELFEKSSTGSQFLGKKLLYIPFDYHAEVHKDHSGWASKVMDIVQEELGMSFYLKQGLIPGMQTSLVRANCIDCLDRTNAVQSYFAKQWAIEVMLKALGITPNPEELNEFKRMMGQFWVHTADAISKQYTGSPALKTDIALIGHRTKKGMMKDFKATVGRHLSANYYDQYRQETMALVYGPDSVDPVPVAVVEADQ